MQTFTLHTHNNELRFDGHVSAREMIAAAISKGFKIIGVTNHLIMHPNLHEDKAREPMFFDDFNEAENVYMRHIEILENLKSEFAIDIKIGFETDFFQDPRWRNYFEKRITRLPVDYLIGASHFLMSEDESFLCNIYHLKYQNPQPDEETLRTLVKNHLNNIVECIKSGYFSFLAHLDYCTIFGLAEGPEYDEDKYRIIEALKQAKMPFEINTSGYMRINRPHPAPWIVKELSANGGLVPVLISDDAHSPERLGADFERAETLLAELNYTNRFTLDMLKKPA